MPLPDLNDEQDGDLGMRFNKQTPERLGPSEYLSSMTAYSMKPAATETPKKKLFRWRVMKNWRRKSRYHFSTQVTQSPPNMFTLMQLSKWTSGFK